MVSEISVAVGTGGSGVAVSVVQAVRMVDKIMKTSIFFMGEN
jgi:hypothetical protein